MSNKKKVILMTCSFLKCPSPADIGLKACEFYSLI